MSTVTGRTAPHAATTFVNLGPWHTLDLTQALCAQPEHAEVNFFGQSTVAARNLCRQCPLQVQCAEYAIPIVDLKGVWGGTTADSRVEIRKERGLRRPLQLTVSPSRDGYTASFKGTHDGIRLMGGGRDRLRALQNLAKNIGEHPRRIELLEMIANELADGQPILQASRYDWGVKEAGVNVKYGAALWAPRESATPTPTKYVMGVRQRSNTTS